MIRSADNDLHSICAATWNAVLPRTCIGCGRRGDDCCPGCAAALPLAPGRPPPRGVDVAVGWLAHRGVAAELVARAKFHHGVGLLERLGDGLGRLMAAVVDGDLDGGDATITWAPTTTAHRRHRGFDQAEVLARAAAHRFDPASHARPTLRRVGGSTQTGRRRDERLVGPRFEPVATVPARVVIVDDVWTTGATLGAAADALRRAGAEWIAAVVLAVRP